MAKPEIKVSITSDGGQKAAADIGKVDQAADKAAKGGLKSLTDKVPGLSGALDKIPGGSALASGGIAALGAASVAGGAALAAFAVKGVMAFEETTLAVGKFRDATGTTAEEASRFVEVFGDLGIGAEAGQAAIGKMEKALGANTEAFKQYGVEVVRAKDGTIDAQGTFLAAVDALNKIRDPAEKAAAGAAIFGKGWQGMAEIIGSGAPALQEALASVQPSKVFSDKDIKSGRDVRDAFDTIRDAGEDLLLTIGKALAPVVARLAPLLGDVIEAAIPLAEEIGGELADALAKAAPLMEGLAKGAGLVADALKLADESTSQWSNGIYKATQGEKIEASREELGLLAAHIDFVAQSMTGAFTESQTLATALIHQDDVTAELNATTETAEDRQKDLAAASDAVTRSAQAQDLAWQALKGTISDDQAWLALQDAFDDVKARGQEAMQAVVDKTDDADQKMRDYQSSVNTAKSNVIELGQQIGLSIPEVKSMLMQIDDGAIDVVEARLRTLTRNRQISIDIIARGGAGYGGRTGDPEGATGGIVTQPTRAIIGEAGPEAVIPLNKTPGSSPLPAAWTAGPSSSGQPPVTINIGQVNDPVTVDAIATAIMFKIGAY